MFEKLKNEFESVGMYDEDVLYSIVDQFDLSGVAEIEINLECLDLVERLMYNVGLQVDMTLLSDDENLFLIRMYY